MELGSKVKIVGKLVAASKSTIWPATRLGLSVGPLSLLCHLMRPRRGTKKGLKVYFQPMEGQNPCNMARPRDALLYESHEEPEIIGDANRCVTIQ